MSRDIDINDRNQEDTVRMREAELCRLNETLERRVEERTAEAESASRQLRPLPWTWRIPNLASENAWRSCCTIISSSSSRPRSSRPALCGAPSPRAKRSRLSSKSKNFWKTHSPRPEPWRPSLAPRVERRRPDSRDELALPKIEEDHGLQVKVVTEPSAEPESEQVRTLLFECARELLANVVKHAQTKEASLTLTMSREGLLNLVVADRGKGFDSFELNADRRESGTSFSLFRIRERLSFIGGLLNIRSAIGEGARMEISIPVGVPSRSAPATSKPESAISTDLPLLPTALDRPARVLVADDHKLFREGIIHLLRQEPDLAVIGEAADGQEAVEFTRTLRPDILILDVSMPKLSGVHVAAQISRELPHTRIIGLSMHEDDHMAKAMRAAGAAAYLTKGGSSETLLDVVRSLITAKSPHP